MSRVDFIANFQPVPETIPDIIINKITSDPLSYSLVEEYTLLFFAAFFTYKTIFNVFIAKTKPHS